MLPREEHKGGSFARYTILEQWADLVPEPPQPPPWSHLVSELLLAHCRLGELLFHVAVELCREEENGIRKGSGKMRGGGSREGAVLGQLLLHHVAVELQGGGGIRGGG